MCGERLGSPAGVGFITDVGVGIALDLTAGVIVGRWGRRRSRCSYGGNFVRVSSAFKRNAASVSILFWEICWVSLTAATSDSVGFVRVTETRSFAPLAID
jgi:hypothetical protein